MQRPGIAERFDVTTSATQVPICGQMTLKRLVIASVVLLPMVICWLLLKFVFISPQERIKKVIHLLAEAVEDEDAEEALSYVSRDYWDETGLDYPQIEELAQQTFGKFDHLRVFLSDLKVEADQDTGRAHLKVAVLARLQGDPVFLIGSFNKPVQATVVFRKEEEVWKIVEAAEE